ncbi:MAG TPA: prepilin peptidase [Candidatus Baltobacteraceae bacterium]|nr:prepilin peptidase [Candidatus Baltobacteraceae bacterium]
MNPHVLMTAILFASAAIVGIVIAAAICSRIRGHADGPPSGTPPVVALVAGAALLGGIAGSHAHPDPAHLFLVAITTAAFAAAWYCDTVHGVIPDVFSVGPLVLVAILAFTSHDPRMPISAAVVAVPFAGAAFLSRGRGMGWGDVKLAAVSGALLGASNALLALALASFGAVVAAKLRPQTSPAAPSQPMAFAPYLIGATALFTAFATL